jgi:hypothetical protein
VPSSEVAREIRRSLHWLLAATIFLYLALAGVGAYTYIKASNNQTALCALRADVEGRILNSEKFLATNPKGIPGFPRATIQSGIDGQRKTVKALGSLNCG